MKTATAPASQTAVGFRNILFATDFSRSANQAIPYVQKLAKHYDAELVALHVRVPVVNPMTEPATWPVYLEAAKALDHEHREELLHTFSGIRTEVLIEEGSIGSCLEAAVAENNTDLIVIGTQGRTGIPKLILGSVAEEIFRTVHCPVLTVGPRCKQNDAPDSQFREILYATDFSAESVGAAAYALTLAQEFQARLVLVHVISDQQAGDLVSAADLTVSSHKMLRKLVSAEAEAWCKPEYFVVQGNPADKILEFATMRESDLLVLGVRPQKGVLGASTHLPIATAHKIVSHAICPVLTVRH